MSCLSVSWGSGWAPAEDMRLGGESVCQAICLLRCLPTLRFCFLKFPVPDLAKLQSLRTQSLRLPYCWHQLQIGGGGPQTILRLDNSLEALTELTESYHSQLRCVTGKDTGSHQPERDTWGRAWEGFQCKALLVLRMPYCPVFNVSCIPLQGSSHCESVNNYCDTY